LTGFAAPHTNVLRPSNRRRVAGALLVVLLHFLLLLAVLHAVIRRPSLPLRGELVFVLPHLLQPARTTRAPLPPRPPARMTLPLHALPPVIPSLPAVAPSRLAAPQAQPDLRGLGQSLFGCAPENLATLTPQQQMRCGSAFAPPDQTQELIHPHSNVSDPDLRAVEMAKKNTPAHVPCTSIASQGAPASSRQVLTLFCTVKIPLP
jgi:hypothetical protein